ncbi:unnamed protein product [Rhizophagus irregularis]|nr:unnamed protein product [Rhizophagus irregularis]CAB5392314.1 unnamed protein product [Rhizophagus irregularis]
MGIANECNAIIVSDHNNIEGALVAQRISRAKYNDSVTVMPVMEYVPVDSNMQFIGINETVLDDFPDFSSDESAEWGYQGVDGLEVVINGYTFSSKENKFFLFDATGMRSRVYPKKFLWCLHVMKLEEFCLLKDMNNFYVEIKNGNIGRNENEEERQVDLVDI